MTKIATMGMINGHDRSLYIHLIIKLKKCFTMSLKEEKKRLMNKYFPTCALSNCKISKSNSTNLLYHVEKTSIKKHLKSIFFFSLSDL